VFGEEHANAQVSLVGEDFDNRVEIELFNRARSEG
jgi:hypothetical protein